MSDIVKLIIEIPKSDYKAICANKEDAIIAHDTCRRIANNGIPLDENKGEWIPVSERLPEKNVWVLVTVEQSGSRYQEIMRRNNYTEAWIGDDGGNYTDEITAWQPLPEPYKGGEV